MVIKINNDINYWDARYLSGNNSGDGSFGKLRDWKHEIMIKFDKCDDIIDVGCANLEFWDGFKLPDKYIGIDISNESIKKNKLNYPNHSFIRANASEFLGLSAKTVICFDVLFHILDDIEYDRIISNICRYSQHNIFIYTWDKNPLRKYYIIPVESDGIYQKYRGIKTAIDICERNGAILKSLEHPPRSIDKYGVMMIFEKI